MSGTVRMRSDLGTESRVSALLGPTNTGKTYLAVERMLEHPSGVIGFPLRLLARENYDKLVRLKGHDAVALVTGEEKIVPPTARWFVCTVEAMPVDRRFEFVAVDEVQLCADRERGHIFTDRLLHARGTLETLFLGAETIRPLLRELLPASELEARPRFSSLSHVGPRKVVRLPPRSAVVAFSVADVYALAEDLRRHKGGTAVVLGALSPRARNAQVQMYQEGEVDYLVATDAIGMGLNLDIENVAFAGLAKFDGEDHRELTPAELAQIAGRAGRFMKEGTFGTTEHTRVIDADVVAQIEHHRFQPLDALVWRNSDLDDSSLEALLASLEAPSPHPALVKGRLADDQRALGILARAEGVRRLVRTSDDVRLLWEACQIPDFRKISAEEHASLIAELFVRLHERGQLAGGFVEDKLRHLDNINGDVEDLLARMANVRTWSYVAFRSGWIDAPDGARDLARAAEDRLSDALHTQLQRRFVDRLSSAMRRRARAGEAPDTALGADGSVVVEGSAIGHLHGFRFEAQASSREDAARLGKAAARSLKQHIADRTAALLADVDASFELKRDGAVAWRGEDIGQLGRGHAPLTPRVEALASALLEPRERQAIAARAEAFVARRVRERLAPLVALVDAELKGPARGLIYQLGVALGAIRRRSAAALIDALSPEDRRRLHGRGVRLGWSYVFLPALLKPAAAELCAVLFHAHHGSSGPLPLPPAGAVSFPMGSDVPPDHLLVCGFERIGGCAYRIDMLDRVSVELHQIARAAGRDGFVAPPSVLSWLGASSEVLEEVMGGLGYEKAAEDRWRRAAPARRTPRSPRPRGGSAPRSGAIATLGDAWAKR